MIYDLNEFEKLVKSGHLRKAETEDLVLYTYTDLCTYEKFWNEFTRMARGIILEKSTGKVIAKPFPKFFNLGEMPETQLLNVPNEAYKCFEKVDGSLGIIYFYKDKWNIATKGSFSSPQAIKGAELLKNYQTDYLRKDCTFLVEIIYPENKIVVDYQKQEKLVLLGIYDSNQNEILINEQGVGTFEFVKTYNYTIQEMVELQKTIPKDQEGFVVRFENGLRLKIKGEEYLKIHKIISNLSPLSFWETMENGRVPFEYLAQVPEEFTKDFQPIVDSLELKYNNVKIEIELDYNNLPVKDKTPESRKITGLFLKQNKLKHSPAMFARLLENSNQLNDYIMKYIRPKGNNLI